MSFNTIEGKTLTQKDITSLITLMLTNIIEKNTPHNLIMTKEPFINLYNGRISYDYSGEVELFNKKSFKDFLEGLGEVEDIPFYPYNSHFDQLLSNVYINQWIATYTSNCGKRWISYKELLEREFEDWKYSNFELIDEDDNELNEELEMEINDIFYDFLENTDFYFFAKMIEKSIEQ